MRTRDLLAITVLTLVVAGTTTAVLLTRVARIGVEGVQAQCGRHVHSVAALAQVALAREPERPPHEALAADPGLRALLDAILVHDTGTVYALIEAVDGRLLVSGATTTRRPPEALPLSALVAAGPAERFWRILREGSLYEHSLPLELDGRPFARVRLGVDTSLLRAQLSRALTRAAGLVGLAVLLSWLVALATARLTHRPIRRLSRQIERLRAGDVLADEPAWDFAIADLAAQLRMLGDELRSERLGRLAEITTLREVLDHIEDGVLFTDEDDAVVFYNRALAEAVGRPLEAVAGLELDEIFAADHPLVAAARRARLEDQDLEHLHASLSDGPRFQEAILSVFRFERQPGASGLVILVKDLGGLRTLHDLVQYSAKVTEMGRITAGVAHEVRNPLQAMQLHLEVIRHRAPPDPAVQRATEAMERAIHELASLVRGVLDYLRPVRLELQEVDGNALVRSLVSFLEPEARRRGIAVTLELDPRKTLLLGDDSRLRQVFMNLIQNAFDAMPEGGRLTVRTEREDGHFRIDVADTGRGIPAEHRERIFQLYYTTRSEGTGIGLAIVHRIIAEHHGTVHVESAPGRGSTFRVRLPLRPPAAATAAGEATS